MKTFPDLHALTVEVRAALGTEIYIDKPDSRSWYTCTSEHINYVPPNKYFPYSQLHEMLSKIYSNDQRADRAWFERSMPNVAKTAGCDFTAMGHLLQHLGYATYGGYHSGIYRKRF
jgi:hypothetical protein